MLIQINTDNHIEGSTDLAARVEPPIAAALERYADRVTRIEAYFKDRNSHKGGAVDKECTLEARLAGLEPIAVSDLAPTLDVALDGALDKLVTAIEHAARRAGKSRRQGIGGD
ncbi:MAG: HPF/RaiA family ribosome-associated protein [Betaproteobacteria bacterium]